MLALVFIAAAAAQSPATKALFDACARGDLVAVRAAFAKGKIDLKARDYPDNATPLMIACNRGSKEVVQYLLEQGADPSFAPSSRYHHSPLFYALMGRQDAVLELLLQKGASPDVEVMPAEFTPTTTVLLLAAELAPSTLALVAKYGDVNKRDQRGWDSVFLALQSTKHGYVDADVLAKLQSLFAAGMRMPDDQARQLMWLMAAYASALPESALYLQKKGVRIDAKKEEGSHALAAAAAGGLLPVVDALLKAGAAPWLDSALALTDKITPANERTLLKLLAAGAPVRDNLLRALDLGSVALTDALLAAKASPMVMDAKGRNALHHAAAGGRAELIAKMIAFGVAVDAPSKEGSTPLAEVVDASCRPTPERDDGEAVIAVLLVSGARPVMAKQACPAGIERLLMVAREREAASVDDYDEIVWPGSHEGFEQLLTHLREFIATAGAPMLCPSDRSAAVIEVLKAYHAQVSKRAAHGMRACPVLPSGRGVVSEQSAMTLGDGSRVQAVLLAQKDHRRVTAAWFSKDGALLGFAEERVNTEACKTPEAKFSERIFKKGPTLNVEIVCGKQKRGFVLSTEPAFAWTRP